MDESTLDSIPTNEEVDSIPPQSSEEMEIPLESTIDIIPTVEEVETIVHPEVLPMDDTTNDSIPNFETDSIPSLPEEIMIPSLPQEIQMEDLTQDIIPPIKEVETIPI